MILKDLIAELPGAALTGPAEAEVRGVGEDGGRVGAGDVFVAVRGGKADGHDHLPQVFEAGAAAVVSERPVAGDLPRGAAWVTVPDAREALAILSGAWFGHPSREMRVAGVTGTNGKTTTAFLLHFVMKETLHRAGLMGTVLFDDGRERTGASHTTPGAPELQELLGRMRDNGCRGAVLEVSSHGLDQKRTAGVAFDAAVFTNLTRDHLDYHGTMDRYFASKRRLFEQVAGDPQGKSPRAVVNLDDRYGEMIARDFKDRLKVTTYGFGARCDFRAGRVRQGERGTEFQLLTEGRSFLVRCPLIGRFNVYNALAVLGAAAAMRISMREAVAALAGAPQVPGRLELVGAARGLSVYVDYAHTPDALENAGRTLRELEPERLVIVFGCGGDRDREKRPLMGRAAGRHGDRCIVTSDNPRSEDPAAVIREIEAGLEKGRYETIVEREDAIREAVLRGREGDVVLIAGKGHEDYQEFADRRIPFDDRKKARMALEERRTRRE